MLPQPVLDSTDTGIGRKSVKLAIDETLACTNSAGTGIAARSMIAQIVELAPDRGITVEKFRSPILRPFEMPRGISRSSRTAYLDLVWGQYRLPHETRLCDITFVPGGIPPMLSRSPIILTVHDIFPLTHGECFPRWQRTWHRLLFQRSLRNVSTLIASSPETASALQSKGFSTGRILRTCGLDTAPIFSPEGPLAEDVSGPFILSVGTIEPRKNLKGLAEAMKLVRQKRPIKWLHVGRNGWGDAHQWTNGNEDWCIQTGPVSIDRLASLYRTAAGFACTSLAEGFCLPLLEAIRSGCPVACSDTQGFQAICSGQAHWFDPSSPEDITRALLEMIETGRTHLQEEARVASSRFSWRNYASTVLDEVERLASASPHSIQQLHRIH